MNRIVNTIGRGPARPRQKFRTPGWIALLAIYFALTTGAGSPAARAQHSVAVSRADCVSAIGMVVADMD
ncbi:MAG: hypothetical protein ACRD4K_03995, partial [Candidatus Acidiferrales bacterium]